MQWQDFTFIKSSIYNLQHRRSIYFHQSFWQSVWLFKIANHLKYVKMLPQKSPSNSTSEYSPQRKNEIMVIHIPSFSRKLTPLFSTCSFQSYPEKLPFNTGDNFQGSTGGLFFLHRTYSMTLIFLHYVTAPQVWKLKSKPLFYVQLSSLSLSYMTHCSLK